MKRQERLLTGGEVAYLLAIRLGPGQNWEGVLNDFRQDRRDFGCAPLLPVTRARQDRCGLVPAAGRAKVPMYRPIDVLGFVESVRMQHGTERPYATGPRRYVVEYDEHNPSAYWRTRDAVQVRP